MEYSTAATKKTKTTDIVRHAGGPNYTRQTIVDTFSLFCSDEIFERIVYYTNLHADNAISEGWYRERWIPVDLMETKAFVGCLLFIGVHRSRHESYESLWSNENGRQYLKATMSLMRFKMLLKFIRFDDKETRSQRRSNDKLSAFREIFELFLSRCRSSYTVGAYCTVDEQLVGFRGRCPFRVYMPNKPNKYGMKIWLFYVILRMHMSSMGKSTWARKDIFLRLAKPNELSSISSVLCLVLEETSLQIIILHLSHLPIHC